MYFWQLPWNRGLINNQPLYFTLTTECKMKKLSLLVCLFLVYTLGGCGKKEPAPAPQAQVQAPVEKPAPPPEAAPAPVMEQKPAPVAMPGTFTVQVAAWETKENAEKLAAFYNGKGYEARVEQAEV